jgi:hypothetical protein
MVVHMQESDNFSANIITGRFGWRKWKEDMKSIRRKPEAWNLESAGQVGKKHESLKEVKDTFYD